MDFEENSGKGEKGKGGKGDKGERIKGKKRLTVVPEYIFRHVISFLNYFLAHNVMKGLYIFFFLGPLLQKSATTSANFLKPVDQQDPDHRGHNGFKSNRVC